MVILVNIRYLSVKNKDISIACIEMPLLSINCLRSKKKRSQFLIFTDFPLNIKSGCYRIFIKTVQKTVNTAVDYSYIPQSGCINAIVVSRCLHELRSAVSLLPCKAFGIFFTHAHYNLTCESKLAHKNVRLGHTQVGVFRISLENAIA